MQLWPEPLDGLDPNNSVCGLDPVDAPWSWTEVTRRLDGPTGVPPNSDSGWQRWYFLYEKPDGTRIKISVDLEPQTRQ